ncbi:DNA adenine methylase [Rhizobium alvei]|uniref:site-specific DNA-methyltransferase (adenine-specific) n=1 Tax=Rhizobium alvei TaxID=1132659 RepID=A0ABT8YJV6_9HYPH|nr:DNA adenine methylase [Rhizobium alvei]MDO6963991.1 DNA adenine methylase [Rhizobium alvei]
MANVIDLKAHPTRHGGAAASPFRYPGGKGFLTPFLKDELLRRFPKGQAGFAEPFCGGAGAALNLLLDGDVKRLFLNDADVRVYSAWRAITDETDRFISAINNTEPTIENWETSLRKLHDTNATSYDFELGFAAFFVNRTSRSGVLLGSGPIGGYDQSGKWKIDARYYKDSLSDRVAKIGALRHCIETSNLDGLTFCRALEERELLSETFLFVDPPYVKAGSRLYFDGMTVAKHDALAQWLAADVAPHWLLTYDDHPLVRENYKNKKEYRLDVRYSLGRRRTERELLFMS